jgi:hypothetical protein
MHGIGDPSAINTACPVPPTLTVRSGGELTVVHAPNDQPTSPIAQFASCVFDPNDVVEIRRLPSKTSTWHTAADLRHELARLIAENRKGQNIYVGANPRTRRGGTTAEDVQLARCLFADFDDTTIVAEVRTRWESVGLPEPTLVVLSGHGLHVWWRFLEPITDLALWSTLQKRIIKQLRSDKAIHDSPRIMRLPGFDNWKAHPHVPCRIISADAGRRYQFDKLCAVLTPLSKVIPILSETDDDDGAGGAEDGISDHGRSYEQCDHGDLEPVDAAAMCLAAMRRMKILDHNDGSHRLFAAACRAVEHDLDNATALATIRAYAAERPFPREWTDAELQQRLRDADKKCFRGKALEVRDDRPKIVITTEEHRVNEAALDALSRDQQLYQHGGTLVYVVSGGKKVGAVSRPADCPRIATLPAPVLRERLTRAVRFMTVVGTNNGRSEIVDAHPPAWSVKAIHTRGIYPGIRPLKGIVEVPILRADGTILDTPGYDTETGLLYLPNGQPPRVSANPSAQEVRAARDLLLDLVCDFPFEGPAHRSSWLSSLFTPLGRHAFDGPAPLHLFDANVRGSGKTLLAEISALIVTGRDIARTPNPRNDEESRKLILALALSGGSLVLIDNVAGQLGSPALDAALTATSWSDRILGRSQIVTMPLSVTWLASGNNIILAGDTTRRVAHCRLNCQHEHPEERDGFRHPKLLAYVREHRGKFLAAALAILRGYFAARCPQSCIRSWGSYEAWSDLIRQCIVWLDLPDPGDTREEIRAGANQDGRVLAALLFALHESDPHGAGMTTTQMIAGINRPTFASLRDAIHELCDTPFGKPPSARSLGNKLKHLRGRVIGGRALEMRQGLAGFATWRVVSAVLSTDCPQLDGTSRADKRSRSITGAAPGQRLLEGLNSTEVDGFLPT